MSAITATLIYKLVLLMSGFGFAYLGYRLFLAGVFAPAGDLDTRFGKNRLVLKQAAPGIFYACFGTAIILGTISKGLVLEDAQAERVPNLPQITVGLPITPDDRVAALEIVSAITDGKKVDPTFADSAMSLLSRVINHKENISIADAKPMQAARSGGRGIASDGAPIVVEAETNSELSTNKPPP